MVNRLNMTVSITYDALPEHYATDDALQMASIDQANYRASPSEMYDLIEANPTQITVVPEGTQGHLTPDDFRGLSLPRHIANLLADIYLRKSNDRTGSEVIRTCGAANDVTQGITNKYTIIRNDGSEKHKGCDYFVLDITHDKFAKPALHAYANACEAEYPLLAFELRGKYDK